MSIADDIRRVHDPREGILKGGRSILLRDIFQKAKKDMPNIDYKQYKAIIYAMVSDFTNRLLHGEVVNLPKGLGAFVVKFAENSAHFDIDGKLRTTYPVNWNATVQLWAEDPEAREKKTKIFSTDRKKSYYLCYYRYKRGNFLLNRNVQFKPYRKTKYMITEYAETHDEACYFKKKRIHER